MKRITFVAASLLMLLTTTPAFADETTENIVTDSTVWTFNDYTPTKDGDKNFTGTDTVNIWAVKSQTKNNNNEATGLLYVRNYKDHYFQMYSGSNGKKSGKFSNGSAWSTTVCARTQAQGSFLNDGTHDATATTSVVSQTDRSVAFNAGCPGTIYIIWGTAGSLPKDNDNRYVNLYVNHKAAATDTVNSETNTKVQYELKAEITAQDFADGKTLVPVYYTGTIGTMLYVVKFVPTATSKEVTLAASGMGTFCAPSAYKVPTGLTAYTAKYADSKVTLTKIESGIIPAGKGVVLSGTANTNYTLEATTETTEAQDNDLTGATVATTINNENTYVLICNSNNKGQFAKLKNGETIPAGKAYLTLSENTSANILSLDFGIETGINTIEKRAEKTDNNYYTLDGKKIEKPQHGTYIYNGKVYSVK